MSMVNSRRHEPAKPPYSFAPRDPIIYMHIFAGENDDVVIRTRAHEKIRLDFFRAEPLYVLYIAGKNVKNCKVRSYLCTLDPSIFHFILIKHGGKIWKLEPSNRICKKNGNGLKSWKLCRLHNTSPRQLCILYNAILAALAALYGANYAGDIGT